MTSATKSSGRQARAITISAAVARILASFGRAGGTAEEVAARVCLRGGLGSATAVSAMKARGWAASRSRFALRLQSPCARTVGNHLRHLVTAGLAARRYEVAVVGTKGLRAGRYRYFTAR